MTDSREQAQFRAHLADMRHAAGGLGRDFANEFSELDRKIERLGQASSKGARYLAEDIQEDFANLGKRMDEEVRRIPQHITNGAIAIGTGASRAGAATRDAFVSAGKAAKTGTKNALASAAGVRKTPMREWAPPSADATGPSDDA
jgi:hypothetical protein